MRVGPEQADRAEVLAVDRHGSHHDGARRQRLEAVLRADGDREAPAEHIAQERDHDQLLLQDAEHRADGLDGFEGLGQASRSTDEDLVGVDGALQGTEGGPGRGPTIRSTRLEPLGGTDHGAVSVRPTRCAASCAPARATTSSETSPSSSMVRFSTAPSERTTTSSTCCADRPTSWTALMVAVSCDGPTTTAA